MTLYALPDPPALFDVGVVSAQLVAGYDMDLKNQGRRAKTRQMKRYVLGAFARSLGERSLAQAHRVDIDSWMATLHILPKTKQAYLKVLLGFYEWASREGHTDSNPTAGLPRYLRPRPAPRRRALVALSVTPSRARDSSASTNERLAFVYQRLVEEELAPRTGGHYMNELRRAECWCEQEGYTLRNVPGEVLAEYVALRPRSYSTRTQIRVALTHYWRILDRKNPPVWAIRRLREPRMVCRALTEAEAHRLADVARERGDAMGLAVLLAMYTGLRREEISTVAWADITEEGWLKLVGKGDQVAALPLHPVVLEALLALPRKDPRWVFPGRFGASCNPATIWHWVKEVAREAGLENISPHRLRHTALATANDATGDLRAVQAFARHAKPETTAGYTRATEKRLRAVMESIDYG